MATDRAFVKDQLRLRGFKVLPAEDGAPHDFVCHGRRDWWPRLVAVGPLDRERRLALVDAARVRRGQPFRGDDLGERRAVAGCGGVMARPVRADVRPVSTRPLGKDSPSPGAEWCTRHRSRVHGERAADGPRAATDAPLVFTVECPIATKGSMVVMRGRARHANPKLTAYTEAVVWAARSACSGPLLPPYRVAIVFEVPRPGRSAKAWPSAWDVDKAARALLDALVTAGVLSDDRDVVELRVAKVYVPSHEAERTVVDVACAAGTTRSTMAGSGLAA